MLAAGRMAKPVSPATERTCVHAIVSEREFVLKATPPRLPRAVLRREHLIPRWLEVRDRPLLMVLAPEGFGKSTLLLQWRRMWLEQGALVAWCTADARDERARFRMALAHAFQHAAGRSRSDALAARHAPRPDWHCEGFTDLLAAIARVRGEMVLMIDECDRLPAATVREALAYLVHNAPENLHIVLAANAPLAWGDAADPGARALTLGAEDLRLHEADTLAILARRIGESLDPDDGRRLHKASEGWPLGLQAAAAAIEQAQASPRAVEAVVWLRGPLQTRFLDALLTRLPVDLLEFLTRIAILDHMNAELCEAVTGDATATAQLARAQHDTPLFVIGQTKDWCCLHPLARAALLAHAARLAVGERRDLHRRAAAWFLAAGQFHDAARHADEAGDFAAARKLRARVVWGLAGQGRLSEAREALARMPADEVAREPDFRLIAAWLHACSDRHAEGLAVARSLLSDPAVVGQERFLAALVAASAAAYGDRIGLIPELLARWPEGSAEIEGSGHAAVFANCLAIHALHGGRTSHLRDIEPRSVTSGFRQSPALGRAIGRILVGLSHLWEGFPDRAEAVLRPALAQAELADGRRSVIASMFAAVTAAALLERNQPAAAVALLAGRMDIIEAAAFPDVIACARRTLACVALDKGDEAQALHILEGLRMRAQAHTQPRLQMQALGELIRIHALAGRIEAMAACEDELDGLAAMFALPDFVPLRPQYHLQSAIAKAHALLARGDVGLADRHLLTADAIASDLGRGRDVLVVRVLRAVVARLRGAPLALRMLGETLTMAKLGGNRRLLLDSHPLSQAMASEWRKGAASGRKALPRAGAQGEAGEPTRVPTPNGTLLTAVEAGVLEHLHRGGGDAAMPPELRQWHLRHVCAKLAVADADEAVARARLLGLIDGDGAPPPDMAARAASP